jgi:hypothetical protein
VTGICISIPSAFHTKTPTLKNRGWGTPQKIEETIREAKGSDVKQLPNGRTAYLERQRKNGCYP